MGEIRQSIEEREFDKYYQLFYMSYKEGMAQDIP